MKIIIRGSGMELTPSIKDFVDEKVGLIGKFIGEYDLPATVARVEVGKPSKHHKSGPIFYAEVNLSVSGKLYRASVEHEDLYTAIDQARDAIEVQLKKVKTKMKEKVRVSRERKKA